jgi:hypothetical protein
MKAEPLEEKTWIVIQERAVKHKLDGVWIPETEEVTPIHSVKSAVEWLKEEYYRICNKYHIVFDDQIGQIPKIIDQAFPDIQKDTKK